LAKSECVFLLFSSKLEQFSSNFFDLDANFFGNQPRPTHVCELVIDMPRYVGYHNAAVSWSTGIFLREIGTIHLSARRLLIPGFSAPQIASFFPKNAHHRDHTTITLPVFAVLIVISSALILSLGAVAATSIGRGSVDE
jgi:hypothetical protein